jgi:hypothetical protein
MPDANPSVVFNMFYTNYKSSTFNANSHLDRQNRCIKNDCVKYNNLVTSVNDPSISQKTRFAQNVKNSSYMRMSVARAIAVGYLNPDGSINTNRVTPNTSNTPTDQNGNPYVNRSYVNIANCPMYS